MRGLHRQATDLGEREHRRFPLHTVCGLPQVHLFFVASSIDFLHAGRARELQRLLSPRARQNEASSPIKYGGGGVAGRGSTRAVRNEETTRCVVDPCCRRLCCYHLVLVRGDVGTAGTQRATRYSAKLRSNFWVVSPPPRYPSAYFLDGPTVDAKRGVALEVRPMESSHSENRKPFG